MKGEEINGELSSDQIKTLVPISIKTTQPTLLKVILNTTVFFKKDPTFTWILELKQLSYTSSNCTVLHDYSLMDSLVSVCFCLADATLISA